MLNIGLRLRQLVGQQFQASSDRFWYLGQFTLNQVGTVATGYVQGLDVYFV